MGEPGGRALVIATPIPISDVPGSAFASEVRAAVGSCESFLAGVLSALAGVPGSLVTCGEGSLGGAPETLVEVPGSDLTREMVAAVGGDSCLVGAPASLSK